ncbi:MAG: hypothetical protein QNK11_02660 [Legionella sp.]|nr:hypothetical protein [Legionella sp.]
MPLVPTPLIPKPVIRALGLTLDVSSVVEFKKIKEAIKQEEKRYHTLDSAPGVLQNTYFKLWAEPYALFLRGRIEKTTTVYVAQEKIEQALIAASDSSNFDGSNQLSLWKTAYTHAQSAAALEQSLLAHRVATIKIATDIAIALSFLSMSLSKDTFITLTLIPVCLFAVFIGALDLSCSTGMQVDKTIETDILAKAKDVGVDIDALVKYSAFQAGDVTNEGTEQHTASYV